MSAGGSSGHGGAGSLPPAKQDGPALKVINPAMSPPLFVPIGMILAGLVGLLLLQPLLIIKAPMIFGPFRYNAATLTAVHLFTLGFATAVMVGAFFQIVPVMMHGDPVNGWWAAAQGMLYLSGVATLVTGFYYYETALIATGGSLVVLAITLFIILVGRSMRSTVQWTISGTYMVAGLTFLASTVLWGLVLAFNLRWNFLGDTMSNAPLGAHLVLGLGGWFMLTIFGVTYQLVPMFALSMRGEERPAKVALCLLATGLGAAYLALALRWPALVTGFALTLAGAGALVYARDMAALIKRRRRPELDLGMRFAMTSFAMLPVSLLLLAAGFPTAAVWLFLPGFVASMILGMLLKIVPFLFWHFLMKHRVSKTQRLPSLTQMYNTKVAEASYWLWTGGTLLTGALLVASEFGLSLETVRWPLGLNAAGSLLFVSTIIQTLRAKPLD